MNTEYTRATLPQAYFPDNYIQVQGIRNDYHRCQRAVSPKMNLFVASVSFVGSGFMLIPLYALLSKFGVSTTIFLVVTLTVLISSPTIGGLGNYLYSRRMRNRLKPLVNEIENKKLKIEDIHHIYLKETNRPIPVDHLIGDELELR